MKFQEDLFIYVDSKSKKKKHFDDEWGIADDFKQSRKDKKKQYKKQHEKKREYE